MNSNHLYADILRHFGQSGGVAVIIIPAKAHLHRDGNIHRLHSRRHNLRRQLLILHQCRARHFFHDLFDRTAKINIDNRRAAGFIHARCFGHNVRITSCQLYRHGKFFGVIFVHLQRSTGLLNHFAAGNHFGEYKPRAILLNQLSKRQISDA